MDRSRAEYDVADICCFGPVKLGPSTFLDEMTRRHGTSWKRFLAVYIHFELYLNANVPPPQTQKTVAPQKERRGSRILNDVDLKRLGKYMC